MERDERAWMTVLDAAYRAEGKVALRLQPCGECGASVATPLTAEAPVSCREHGS